MNGIATESKMIRLEHKVCNIFPIKRFQVFKALISCVTGVEQNRNMLRMKTASRCLH